jgi:SNF2 family DNA or RNA helicase
VDKIHFAQISPGTALYATEAGLFLEARPPLTGESISFSSSELAKGGTNLKAIADAIPMLLEEGIAALEDGGLLVPSDSVHQLLQEDYGLRDVLPEQCPFALQIKSAGSVGSSDFGFTTEFYLGPAEVFCMVLGAFVKRASTLYLLPKSVFDVLTAIRSFNELDPAEKTKTNALRCISRIKSFAEHSVVAFDSYIQSENVIIPKKLGIDLRSNHDSTVTAIPTIDGTNNEQLGAHFLAFNEVQDVYDLDAPDGGRFRIILEPEVKEAAQRIKQLRHLRSQEKDRLCTAPETFFEGMADIDVVDFQKFGPRVKGIGPYVFQPKPYIRPVSAKFLEGIDDSDTNYELGLKVIDCDDVEIDISLAADALPNICKEAEEQLATEAPVLSLMDKFGQTFKIPLSKRLLEDLQALQRAKTTETSSSSTASRSETATADPNSPLIVAESPIPLLTDKSAEKKYVLIHENEERLDYQELPESAGTGTTVEFHKPKALIEKLNGEPFELKLYQKEGVGWLQHCFNLSTLDELGRRRGGLLADEMGLGKTLQVLTFLSWVIEDPLVDELGKDQGPYKSILVVAPVILLEVWKKEIAKFFKDQGEVFSPYVVLHGDELRKFKMAAGGREYKIGESTLDLERIKRYRMVITNYDTVKNYQHSFAKIAWSVVVTDEAQEIKEPKTAVTQSLKSLNAGFRVALTGTPVENRLLDLWNIVDFVQPGLLGAASAFTKTFESEQAILNDTIRHQRAETLRQNLQYSTPSSFILRRLKTDKLEGLPEKKEFTRFSELSRDQQNLHHQILQDAKRNPEAKGMHLKAIQRLVKVYQHTALELGSVQTCTPKELIQQSPKLQETLKILHEIRGRREKVLIFALLRQMQLILKKAIEHEFSFTPNIINGSTEGGATNLRHKLIKEFEDKQGFNCMILSPDVAGVGLTIVGANNVIHYGRWWNPAKEAQATDRVHRLGQTKEVNVYYPLSASSAFPTFDFKLHSLLEKKRELAKDFLVPTVGLELTEDEIDSFLAEPGSTASGTTGLVKDVASMNTEKFQALCALFFENSGYKMVLTPESQNADIHAIGWGKEGLLLISVLTESIGVKSAKTPESFDRAKMFFENKQALPGRIKYACCMQGRTERTQAQALKQSGIQLVEDRELNDWVKKQKVAHSDLAHLIDSRVDTIEELTTLISRWSQVSASV